MSEKLLSHRLSPGTVIYPVVNSSASQNMPHDYKPSNEGCLLFESTYHSYMFQTKPLLLYLIIVEQDEALASRDTCKNGLQSVNLLMKYCL